LRGPQKARQNHIPWQASLSISLYGNFFFAAVLQLGLPRKAKKGSSRETREESLEGYFGCFSKGFGFVWLSLAPRGSVHQETFDEDRLFHVF
jgi:hypothetical protein